MIERGFQFTSLQSDDRFLMQRAKQEVDAVRDASEQGRLTGGWR